ncbi:MAG: Flagellin protein FlaG [Candidatus Ozemobacter sibiricus]|jgi:flagellar protein FlaG|uniref:Flagellin protein FlaG n=1 Tax=Candidatus Ozemobacter sibiricus TaxID=2268124 RepID=A0A367ZPP2_9BACT|nr:MAG: Flagellin protein FlaG [Candidatus Ozemobacter sibiricus]
MEIGNVKMMVDPAAGASPPDPATTLPTLGTPQPMEQEAVKAQQEQQDPEKQRKKVEEAVEKMNQTAVIFDRSLRFQIHDKTKSTMVAVIDSVSNRVIREIPSKEVLELFAKMQDYLGMIFDKKA